MERLPRDFPQNGTSSGLASSFIALAGEGHVYGFTVYNSNASAQFILLFDQSTPPSAGETADLVLKVSGSDFLPVNWIPGRYFRQGCVLCNSSTQPTLTAGAADCFFDVQYSHADR